MLASIYIRKDDEDKWKALQNKTQLISDLLNNGDPSQLAEERKQKGTPVKIPKITQLNPRSGGFCPHGYGKGMCKSEDCNKKNR